MSTERITEILELNIAGSEYLASDYDTGIDIAVPKQYLITTGDKKCHLVITIKTPALAITALNKTVVIGTGGGASAGSALNLVKRDQSDTTTPITTIKSDYVLGSSGQSAGTAIYTDYTLPNVETKIKFKLAPSSNYGLIFTTIADNNSGTFLFEFEEY